MGLETLSDSSNSYEYVLPAVIVEPIVEPNGVVVVLLERLKVESSTCKPSKVAALAIKPFTKLSTKAVKIVSLESIRFFSEEAGAEAVKFIDTLSLFLMLISTATCFLAWLQEEA
jgi:hypothetical protein